MRRHDRPRRRRTRELVAIMLLTVSLAACSTAVHQQAASPRPTSASPSPGALATPGAGRPRAPIAEGVAPAQPFPVGVRDLRFNRGGDRPLPVTVWYPATGRSGGTPQRNLDSAPGRFPLIVFSHGLAALPADYEPLLSRWAAAGFVVVAPAYPHTGRAVAHYDILDVFNQPADASYVLTQVLALDTRPNDPFQGHLATDRVAAAGHSAGAVTTIGLFTAARDDRLSAGIVMAGTALGAGTTFAGPAAPQLFIHGELDKVISYAAGKAAYDMVPWPKAMLSLPKGDHGQSLLQAGNQAFTVVADTTVDFLRWTLYGDPAAKRRLPAGAARGGLATLDDRL